MHATSTVNIRVNIDQVVTLIVDIKYIPPLWFDLCSSLERTITTDFVLVLKFNKVSPTLFDILATLVIVVNHVNLIYDSCHKLEASASIS